MTTTSGLNVHIYPAPIVSESRIFRETLAVARASIFDSIEICGTPGPGLPNSEALSDRRTIRRIGSSTKDAGSVLDRIRFQLSWSARVYRTYSSSPLKAVNAHSVAVLPVAALLARRTGARLIYDTHELETETSTSRGLQGRLFRILERLLVRRCDVVFVVNDLLKEWYEKSYPGSNVVSVVNAPDRAATGVARDFRKKFEIPTGSRLYVHVGNLVGARHIEEIIGAFATRPNDHIVFLGDGDYGPVVNRAAITYSNIHHHHSIESDSVVPTLSTADVGICLIEPSCLSYQLALPNKAIEYTAAGIPFIHNELPAIRRLLADRLAAFNISSVKRDLGGLLDRIDDEMVTAGGAELDAVDLPSWETESRKMIDAYRRIGFGSAEQDANHAPRREDRS